MERSHPLQIDSQIRFVRHIEKKDIDITDYYLITFQSIAIMRFFAVLSLSLGCASAFTTQLSSARWSPSIAMTQIDKDYTVGSGMTERDIPLFINNLTIENFEESIAMLEPLLTNECVGDMCDDYVGALQEKASALGKELPPGYAATHH